MGYQRAIGQFDAFRKEMGYPGDWPFPMDQLLHYGVHMKRRGLAASTIKGNFFHPGLCCQIPWFSEFMGDFLVQKMLKGWKREEGPRQDPYQPLSPAILLGLYEIWGSVCTSDFEVALFHTAAFVAFFGALRICVGGLA